MNAEADDDDVPEPRTEPSRTPRHRAGALKRDRAEMQSAIDARRLGNRILEEIDGFLEIEDQFKRTLLASDRKLLAIRALGHAMGRLNAQRCHDADPEACEKLKNEWGAFESDAWVAEKRALGAKVTGS